MLLNRQLEVTKFGLNIFNIERGEFLGSFFITSLVQFTTLKKCKKHSLCVRFMDNPRDVVASMYLRLYTLFAFLIGCLPLISSHAQDVIYNDGAEIYISGTDMFVSGGDVNNSETTGNSIITITNDGSLGIDGSLTNEDTVFVLDGTMNIVSDYDDNAEPSAYLVNDDTVRVFEDFINTNGIYWHDPLASDGVIIFDGGGTQNIRSTVFDEYNHIVFDGGGNKIIHGHLIAHDYDFTNGIVFPNANVDTIVLMAGGTVNSYSATSYYDGMFWNEAIGNAIYPIGNAGDFRPVILSGLVDTAIIGFRVSGFNPVGYAPIAGRGVQSVSTHRYWQAEELGSNYSGGTIQLTFAPADTNGIGATSIGDVSVVQADTLNTPFRSIGNAASGPAPFAGLFTVDSDLIAGEDYYSIGSGCNNIKLDIRAYLEGGHNSGGPIMEIDANHYGFIEGIFGNNGPGDPNTGNLALFPGYPLPSGAADSTVDVITLYLRETTIPYNYVDTAFALLMEDGSIRDFNSGSANFATFCKAGAGQNYYVELRHRNHMPVMNNTIFTASTIVNVTPIDFTNIANIWGGGGMSFRDGNYYIATGNARNNDISVNALDFLDVMFDQAGLVSGYTETNINFDNDVNASDYTVAGDNSVNLIFSTIP